MSNQVSCHFIKAADFNTYGPVVPLCVNQWRESEILSARYPERVTIGDLRLIKKMYRSDHSHGVATAPCSYGESMMVKELAWSEGRLDTRPVEYRAKPRLCFDWQEYEQRRLAAYGVELPPIFGMPDYDAGLRKLVEKIPELTVETLYRLTAREHYGRNAASGSEGLALWAVGFGVHVFQAYAAPHHEKTLTGKRFARMSKTRRGFISYIRCPQDGMNGTRTVSKIGAYLTKYHSDLLSDRAIQALAQYCSAQFELLDPATAEKQFEILTDGAAIAGAYMEHGVACMGHDTSSFETDGIHPTEVYGDSDLALAVLYTDATKTEVGARAIIWPSNKTFNTIYGSKNGHEGATPFSASQCKYRASLAAYLQDTLDYERDKDGPVGARIRKLTNDHGAVILPYIDGCGGTLTAIELWDQGMLKLVDEGGDYVPCHETGLASEGEGYTSCRECGESVLYTDATYTFFGEPVCYGCYASDYVTCCVSGDVIHQDDARWDESGNVFRPTEYDARYDNCEVCGCETSRCELSDDGRCPDCASEEECEVCECETPRCELSDDGRCQDCASEAEETKS